MAANYPCGIEQQQFAISLPGHMEAIMRAYIVIGALTVLAMFALVYRANTQDRRYAGFNCTIDCSSYEAGYKWAEQYGIDDEEYCANYNQSFYEGCVAYVQEPDGAANEPITASACRRP
jgi:hypothetical protein